MNIDIKRLRMTTDELNQDQCACDKRWIVIHGEEEPGIDEWRETIFPMTVTRTQREARQSDLPKGNSGQQLIRDACEPTHTFHNPRDGALWNNRSDGHDREFEGKSVVII